MEYHDVVHAVEELGPEMVAQHTQHLFRLFFMGILRTVEYLAAQIGGHDHDGVLEVDRAPLAVGDSPVIQELQQNIEHLGMSLLDLVEENHAVRAAAHGFGELAAFFVPDVAGRGANKTRHGVLLHILGHVDAHHGVFVVKQQLGQ